VDKRALVAWSVERMGELGVDPTAEIYRRLFAKHPELEALFVLDRDGAARGNMLSKAFECLIDMAGARAFGVHFVLAEATNHEGIGVSREVYATFFDCIVAVARDTLSREWTPDVEAAWAALIAEVRRNVAGSAP
jgi:hemoglobin-like flavoprotein